MNKIAKRVVLSLATCWSIIAIIGPPVMLGIGNRERELVAAMHAYGEAPWTEPVQDDVVTNRFSLSFGEARGLAGTFTGLEQKLRWTVHLCELSGLVTLLIAGALFFGDRRSGGREHDRDGSPENVDSHQHPQG